MATPSLELISAVRRTARKLKQGAPYQWGNMGSCNCGNLAQELTSFTKAEIHEFAMQKLGDWSNQMEDYCPTSGYPMDHLITSLMEKGLTERDLKNLEWLSDRQIVAEIGRELQRNNRQDAIDYMKTWARLMEHELIGNINIGQVISSNSEIVPCNMVTESSLS